MSEKLIFIAGQYLALAAILLACWGAGAILLRRLRGPAGVATAASIPFTITLGLGLCILVLQGLAIAGLLRPGAVLALLGTGLGCAGWCARRQGIWRPPAWRSWRRAEQAGVAVVLLLLLPTALAPLAPPMAWDELMYHLPHARQWADSGRLVVSEWLRYPWFPYNFDLLFALALVLHNDVLPHLLHAAAGWLVGWLIYQLGVRYLDRLTACVAVVIWLALSWRDYTRAYVDMGVTLFVLAAGLALHEWRTSGARGWLAAAGFLIGIAVGAKYQALGLLPFFAAVLALHDRRPASWALAILSMALPCAYWYGRNALLTGDPFNPIGGPVFGFTDWNLADHRWQFEDLRMQRDWPHWILWPALLAPFLPTLRRSAAVRGAMVLAGYMLVFWAATSRYPRYLMSAYPLLALLAAASWRHLLGRLTGAWSLLRARRTAQITTALIFLVLVPATALTGRYYWRLIAPTAPEREALLQARVPGFQVWRYLHSHPAARTYQVKLEDTIYYAPQPIWGEVFGPWRYRDFIEGSPGELHAKLRAQGFDTLVVHTARAAGLVTRPGFNDYFQPVFSDGPVVLYRLSDQRRSVNQE